MSSATASEVAAPIYILNTLLKPACRNLSSLTSTSRKKRLETGLMSYKIVSSYGTSLLSGWVTWLQFITTK